MTVLENFIVEQYPVERLPDEWQRRLNALHPVRVTIEQETMQDALDKSENPKSLLDFYGCSKGLYESEELDPTEFVRQLRDEWS